MKNRKHYPKLLFISGSGRNVGKTMLGCKIVENFNKIVDVAVIKIVAHKHIHDYPMIMLKQTNNYTIWKENRGSNKDSGKYFTAGAQNVFYIEADDNYQQEAFVYAYNQCSKKSLIICETGSLTKIIKPDIMVFVHTRNKRIDTNKIIQRQLSDVMIYSFSKEISNPKLFISIENGLWKLI